MSLADAYTAGPKGRSFAKPTAVSWLDGLSDEDRDTAWKMIRDPEWTSSELFRVFANNGLPGASNTFDGWRRRVLAR